MEAEILIRVLGWQNFLVAVEGVEPTTPRI